MLFSGGLGGVRFTVALNDLTGLFQPKCFYDSVLQQLLTEKVYRI